MSPLKRPIRDEPLQHKLDLLREAFERIDTALADISARACALLARELPVDNFIYPTIRLQIETIVTLRTAIEQQSELALLTLDQTKESAPCLIN